MKFYHGYTGKRLFIIWNGMLQRCKNPNHQGYKWYGGRGIKVCERWKKFVNFLADVGDPPEGKDLDRIDSNGDYEPGNVRWVSPKENNRNKRNTSMIEYKGQSRKLVEVAEEIGINRRTLACRLATGHPDPFSPIVGRRFKYKKSAKNGEPT